MWGTVESNAALETWDTSPGKGFPLKSIGCPTIMYIDDVGYRRDPPYLTHAKEHQ